MDKLSRLAQQLDKIENAEFIRASTLKALQRIKLEINRLRKDVKKASELGDERFLWPAGVTINRKIFSLANSVGVLLRSTNLRNCFEAYYALDEIAERLTGDKDVLIISSEWDASPFFIPEPPDALKEFIFIGMPAFVSRNALLLPLASHEIGHAIWRREQIDGRLSTTAEYKLRLVSTIISRQALAKETRFIRHLPIVSSTSEMRHFPSPNSKSMRTYLTSRKPYPVHQNHPARA